MNLNSSQFYYSRMSTNLFFSYLKRENYAQTLLYMLTYELHENIEIRANPYSIEISNDKITVYIILFVGFENREYQESLSKENVHYVVWDKLTTTLCEFEGFANKIKIIPIKSWCYTAFELDKENRDLNLFLKFKDLNPTEV